MRIYTGTGDQGRTSLFSGERVPKNSLRIEAYGDLDELSCALGAVVEALPDPLRGDVAAELEGIQTTLLQAGAWLATTPGAAAQSSLKPLSPEDPRRLEQAIDRMEMDLEPLHGFVLPGGHRASCWAHVARTICRRSERRLVGLMDRDDEQGAPREPGEAPAETAATRQAAEQVGFILIYLNRLSDYLFVLARTCNRAAGRSDRMWEP